jgi:alkanesulfonate monooxygenase SsuD/methylene tetrahydromethanopterin reductase-like flavin-dependent oxidoreductase (luciferase family)
LTAMGVTFGIDGSASIGKQSDAVARAQAAEAVGFDFVSLNDHVIGSTPRFEAWTLLTWVAARTSRIKVAARVLGVPYRSPALVAKMAESLDRLSDGRLILGLGAGSGEAEFTAMGIPGSTTKDRIDGLEDALTIIRGLWTGRPFSHLGTRYRSIEAQITPPPSHNLPIWLGAVGPRGLHLTGRAANGWIPSVAYAPPERAPAMIEQIVAAAEGADRDPSAIARVYNVEVSFDPNPDLNVVSGTADEIVDRLDSFLDLGFTGFNLIPLGRSPNEVIARLGQDVVPQLRGRRADPSAET